MRLFFILLLVCFVNMHSDAQNENWETYISTMGKKPSSILVDLALINKAPVTAFPYLLITGPKSNECQPNGLPAKSEIERLEDILTATDLFITGIIPFRHLFLV